MKSQLHSSWNVGIALSLGSADAAKNLVKQILMALVLTIPWFLDKAQRYRLYVMIAWNNDDVIAGLVLEAVWLTKRRVHCKVKACSRVKDTIYGERTEHEKGRTGAVPQGREQWNGACCREAHCVFPDLKEWKAGSEQRVARERVRIIFIFIMGIGEQHGGKLQSDDSETNVFQRVFLYGSIVSDVKAGRHVQKLAFLRWA